MCEDIHISFLGFRFVVYSENINHHNYKKEQKKINLVHLVYFIHRLHMVI